MSYSTLKMTFSGDLDIESQNILPQQIREKTRYYMILCDFIRKIVKFLFLDSGHFSGHFEFAQPTRSRSEIFGLETRIVFIMLKPYSVPNLRVVSILGISERLAHCTC